MYTDFHGMKWIGNTLKKAMPIAMFRVVLATYHKVLALLSLPSIYRARWMVLRSVGRIKSNDNPVRIGFYVVLESMFQMRRVFELMLSDPRFDPFIVVSPRVGWGEGDMGDTVEKTYAAIVRDFPDAKVYKGYCDGVFENHIGECDVCAMMNVYESLVEARFRPSYFAAHGVPIFATPYSYTCGTVHVREYYNMSSLKYVYKMYFSNSVQIGYFNKYQRLNLRWNQAILTGCSKTDMIRFYSERKGAVNTVLIAPHHSVIPSVDSGICIGNFFKYKDYLLALPERYPNINWILRPHPHLKFRLIKDCGWSPEQWNEYIRKWESYSNAEYEDGGPYYDSFDRSDAIIQDCGSFLPEYFYTGKPHCYMLDSVKAKDFQFDEWGHELLDHTYQAFTEQDITRFIEDVVIGGKDTMREMRQKFAKEKVMINYPHASEAVLEDIAETLGRGKRDMK